MSVCLCLYTCVFALCIFVCVLCVSECVCACVSICEFVYIMSVHHCEGLDLEIP